MGGNYWGQGSVPQFVVSFIPQYILQLYSLQFIVKFHVKVFLTCQQKAEMFDWINQIQSPRYVIGCMNFVRRSMVG